ncbi:MAG: acyl-CoA thioesterase II [Pseudomonadota bacterium]
MTQSDNVVDQRAQALLDILELQQIEQNLYLGQNEQRFPLLHAESVSNDNNQFSQQVTRRLFGGQVLAQAAMAAYRTVEEVQLHSLHAYFIKAGSTQRPVLYEIERIRDGRSFKTRRVVAVQGGEAIFNMDVSFQIREPGFDHAHPMPNVPMPDELTDDSVVAAQLSGTDSDDHLLANMAKLDRPFELRSVFPIGSEAWAADRFWSPTWIRFKAPVDAEDQRQAQCLLAYASDMGMVSTATLPHQSDIGRHQLQMASLDHALWIHRPVPIDQWLLFHKRTSTSQGARGLVHADFYAINGELIASMTQEGLIRVRG